MTSTYDQTQDLRAKSNIFGCEWAKMIRGMLRFEGQYVGFIPAKWGQYVVHWHVWLKICMVKSVPYRKKCYFSNIWHISVFSVLRLSRYQTSCMVLPVELEVWCLETPKTNTVWSKHPSRVSVIIAPFSYENIDRAHPHSVICTFPVDKSSIW